MTVTCRCIHPRAHHDTGNGLEPCLRPACGCNEWRVDPRSRLGEPGPDTRVRGEPGEGAATRKGAACGCTEFRLDPRSLLGAGRDCQMPCDPDCEIGPVHCWNRHRPDHKPDWHDGAACDAAQDGKNAATGDEAA